MKPGRWMLISAMTLVPLVMGQSCPLFSGGSSQPTLTEDERSALESSLASARSLSQGIAVVQAPATDDASGLVAGSVTVGTCPAITTELAPDSEEGVAASLTIDFGATPCEPSVLPGLFCSGSAEGTFNSVQRSIVVTYDSLTCGDDSLNGTTEITYLPTLVGFNLVGSFDLNWTNSSGSVATDGQGNYAYNRSTKTSSIGSFSGSITDASGEYTAMFTDVVISYPNNANLIPSGGVITLTGPDIRKLTVRFDADSPTTGEVDVSVSDGAFHTVDLDSL